MTFKIDELALLEAAATPGPWTTTKSTWKSKIDPNYTWSASGIQQDEDVFGDMASAIAYAEHTGQIRNEDADFIAAARNALPELLSLLSSFRAAHAALRAAQNAYAKQENQETLAALRAAEQAYAPALGRLL